MGGKLSKIHWFRILSTKEERRVSTSIGENATEESDMDIDTLDVRQHVGLIRQFALHGISSYANSIMLS